MTHAAFSADIHACQSHLPITVCRSPWRVQFAVDPHRQRRAGRAVRRQRAEALCRHRRQHR
ncbi:hypothetical protein DB843_23335, partial [Xanthomonas perforans]